MAHSVCPFIAPSTFLLKVVNASIRLPLNIVMAPREIRNHDCHFCSLTATRLIPSMCALARGKAAGRVTRIDIICSSIT